MKALRQNRGGITGMLAKKSYTSAALVPPMPWISTKKPATPVLRANRGRGGASVSWTPVRGVSKYAVQARYGRNWFTVSVLPASRTSVTVAGSPDAIAVRSVDRYGTTSTANVVGK